MKVWDWVLDRLADLVSIEWDGVGADSIMMFPLGLDHYVTLQEDGICTASYCSRCSMQRITQGRIRGDSD